MLFYNQNYQNKILKISQLKKKLIRLFLKIIKTYRYKQLFNVTNFKLITIS